MKLKKKIPLFCVLFVLILIAGTVLGVNWYINNAEFGFARQVSDGEAQLRLAVVSEAESWLGAREDDGSHQAIIDLYNSHTPLARGYEVQYTDNWCATFGSAVAIACGLTDIIPTECGCERQIQLFMELGRWEEDDSYLPLPGDYIFYAWGENPIGDCTGWADHVGIVVGTAGPFIKVIEGNKDDDVSYRVILRGDPSIRGYGLPDYTSASE